MSILSELGKFLGEKFKIINNQLQEDKVKISTLEKEILLLKSEIENLQNQKTSNRHTTDIDILNPNKGIILRDEQFYRYRIRINSENKLIVDKIDTNEKYYAEIQLSLSGSELNE
ncbi:MAG: hypothetical protein CMC82_03550 [Flavobacteriaceae bacterium]|nr:hypothetical protein [Flavobacteriaceae bacterium]|tara:strand:- start:2446 stop:2790 length:345 start_codon:yes stop_codon:yes gene_type:complete